MCSWHCSNASWSKARMARRDWEMRLTASTYPESPHVYGVVSVLWETSVGEEGLELGL